MMQVVERKMDPQQFCYWLQGFAELNNGVPPNDMQWKAIRDHLALVFNKVTPNYPGLGPNWQKEIIKDWKPEPAHVPGPYDVLGPNTLQPPWTITCTSGQPNNQSMSVC